MNWLYIKHYDEYPIRINKDNETEEQRFKGGIWEDLPQLEEIEE